MFIFLLMFILFSSQAKFTHKNNKRKKNIKGTHQNLINNYNTSLKKETVVEVLDSVKEDAIKSKFINELFDIKDKSVYEGFNFFQDFQKGRVTLIEEEKNGNKIYIGNNYFYYDESNSSYLSSEKFQHYINNCGVNLLTLFLIKSFFVKNNVDFSVKNNSQLFKEEINFISKYSESDGYLILLYLERHVELYKKILLMIIFNILEKKNFYKKKKYNFFSKWYQKNFNHNKFYDMDIARNELIKNLKKINYINSVFDLDKDIDFLLYFLIYNIQFRQDKSFLSILTDEKTLKYLITNYYDMKLINNEEDKNMKKNDTDKEIKNKEKSLEDKKNNLKNNVFSQLAKEVIFDIVEELLKT